MASGYPHGRDRHGKSHTPVQVCRDCGQPLLWVTMPSGKRNALDPAPTIEGYVLVVELPRDWRLGVQLHDDELKREAIGAGQSLRTSHFDTCPKRQADRRPRYRADIDG